MKILAYLKTHLSPDAYYPSLFAINLNDLKAKGIRLILLDLDHTLISPSDKAMNAKATGFLEACASLGIQTVILSNNKPRSFIPEPYVAYAFKPLKFAFLRVLRQYDIPLKACCMIGDQIVSDVWGAKRIGMKVILVDGLKGKDKHLSYLTKIASGLLKIVVKDLPKKGDYYDHM